MTVIDNRYQKSTIGMGGWYIIKHNDSWIYDQGVDMGDVSKRGPQFQFIDAKGVLKNHMRKKNVIWL